MADVPEHGGVATRLPARDLERARPFHAETPVPDPVEERPGGLPDDEGARAVADIRHRLVKPFQPKAGD